MSRFSVRGLVVAATGALALAAWGSARGDTERPVRTGNVTIRILASAHDRGEIKPCG